MASYTEGFLIQKVMNRKWGGCLRQAQTAGISATLFHGYNVPRSAAP
jgi:hypothetical protein